MVDWIVNVVNSLGYVGIALLMFLENIIPPIPSELIMPLAGFAVTQGTLELPKVIVAGVMGSVLGVLPWYYFGRYWGVGKIKKLADRYGKWLTISSREVERANSWFDRRGNIATCFGRMVPAVRTLISIPAGINNMPILLFLLYTTVGTAIWVSGLAYAGYLLGANYKLVEKFIEPITIGVVVGLVGAFVLWIFKRKMIRR